MLAPTSITPLTLYTSSGLHVVNWAWTDPLRSNHYYLNWHFTCIDMKTETEGVSSFWLFCLVLSLCVSSCFTLPPLFILFLPQ